MLLMPPSAITEAIAVVLEGCQGSAPLAAADGTMAVGGTWYAAQPQLTLVAVVAGYNWR
ncbi:hypothetical protein FRC12_020343 [Ceratobasidium sp. 428]|nr:hypothetical protein FRC12_020343 [Ceratobasidium sp. 428]